VAAAGVRVHRAAALLVVLTTLDEKIAPRDTLLSYYFVAHRRPAGL
jgi:hypothetical protein